MELKESYNYNHFSMSLDSNLPNKVMSEIAGFINSKYGGSLVLGVKDNGEILGLESNFEHSGSKKNQDDFELALTSKLRSSFGALAIDLVEKVFYVIESKVICELKITPNSTPVFLNEEFYVRNGTQCNKLNNKEFFELMTKRRK
jgi:predicted HTH transcriptional regulator